jgi:hypothetical protein
MARNKDGKERKIREKRGKKEGRGKERKESK